MRSKSTLGVEEVVAEGGGVKGKGEEEFDAIVIGSGIGGLVAGTQLAVKGARVLVLEKYVIPGGSSGFYQRDGYTFDVGSSVMFGLSWYLDNGCSRHMTEERSMFLNIKPVEGGVGSFGGMGKGKITGIGKIGIPSLVSIDNILYVECLKYNLLSISQF